jgi:hypothetical protein
MRIPFLFIMPEMLRDGHLHGIFFDRLKASCRTAIFFLFFWRLFSERCDDVVLLEVEVR